MPDGSDKDQDSRINDSVHPSVLSSSQNHALPVKHNVFSSGLDEKKEKGRTAADSVQSGWPIVAAKKPSSLARMRSKSKLKPLDIREEKEKKRKRTREVREQALPSAYHCQAYLLDQLPF
ncbi:hypothetical protein TNCV_528521 [Trichonephila clavipes]|nr:hypothetical protein TNCV_528521 [Trichonephila clavipes]